MQSDLAAIHGEIAAEYFQSHDESGPLQDAPEVHYPVANIADSLAWCNSTGKLFWSLPAEHEPDLWPWLAEVWTAMGASVRRGLESSEEILPGGLGLRRKAESAYARAKSLRAVLHDLSLISAYALAVSEENAAGGTVVTAPTRLTVKSR